MNGVVLLGMCVAASLTAVAGSVELANWRFSRDGENWAKVSVPHDWAIAGPFDKEIDKQVVRIVENQETKETEKTGRTGALPWLGRGEYRCMIDIPAGAAWASLVFSGAMSEPEVFCDGTKIGEWKYGYTPFEVELPVASGRHEIAVKLNNRAKSSRWYPGAGLYRPVVLRWGKAVGIKTWGQSLHTPDVETLVVKTELRNPLRAKASVSYRILDAAGNEVAAGGSPLKVPGARTWSPESPSLYTLETTVRVGDDVADVRRERFGFRTVEYGKGWFKLNGVARKFKGVCLHHDLGPLGAAFDGDAFRRQVLLLKEMGCDSIRTSHNIPAPEQLAICDELGMMVMAESFDAWELAKVQNGYNLWFKDWWRRDLTQLVLTARNHPSVVMWSIGNEVPDQTKARGAELTKTMQDFIHTLDPDPKRLVTQGASDMPAAIKSGVIAAMEIPAVTYRLKYYEAIHAASPAQGMVLGVETASTLSSRGVYKFPDEPRTMPTYEDGQCSGYDTEYCIWSNLPDDDWAMQDDHAWTIGEFVWTGFDYLGEPTPYDRYWPSRSSYFGIFDLAGLPKDRFWLYRSRWNTTSHTLHLVPHWTWPGREGQVTPVSCYTDFAEAELFVNGKSQGRRRKDPSTRLDRYRLRWRDVVYEPGELKVVAYDAAGKAAMTETVCTAGAFARFEEKTMDIGRHRFVTVTAVDANGTPCPDYDGSYEVKPPAGWRFKAICNGDATSLELFVTPKMKLFKGQLVYVLEAVQAAPKTANYWCTWETQNYTIDPARQMKTLGFVGDQGAQGARDNIDEEVIFGKNGKGGWVEALPPETRAQLYFLIDDGWDVGYGHAPGKDVEVFGSLEVATNRFPSFTGTPAERLRKFNAAVVRRGWKGLGLWCATQRTGEKWKDRERPFDDIASRRLWREKLGWVRTAGIGYLKFDWGVRGGDVAFRRMLSELAKEIVPDVIVEQCTGAWPINEPERMIGNPAYDENRAKAKELMGFADVFRFYDLLNPFTTATGVERAAFYLGVQAEAGGSCILSTEDEIYLGASLGCAWGAMRSPFAPDARYPVRPVNRKMNEVVRATAWQRLVPPFASKEPPRISSETLFDTWFFKKGEGWYAKAQGHTTVQKAPAAVARGMSLPAVRSAEADGLVPFVTVCRAADGSVSLGAIPRVDERRGWLRPKAHLAIAERPTRLAVFGYVASVTFPSAAPCLYARDLAGGAFEEVTAACTHENGRWTVPGEVLNRIGTLKNGADDLSDPGTLIETQPSVL